MARTALVAGASGLVGGHVLRLLLGSAAYDRVTVLVRRELPLAHKKLTQRVIDFDRLAEVGDFPRVDDVFCCLGTTIKRAGSQHAFRKVDSTYVVELARIAGRHRARQFLVVTAVGADPASRVFYSRVKGETEAALRRLSFDALLLFRPSFLLGVRPERRLAESLAAALAPLVTWTLVGPLARYRPIEAETVARAMVRAAGEAPRGAHVYESNEIRRLAAA